ncbi:UDP-N-acetylglucosamine 1-carboxyvinyltransferase [Candidatus Peregrinibacteria bacterium]|jgi:UDP-N-acetylglucosamine 1-carboxyvinyltransferase|nr:UDP-N-acetylglucosamine 1-carboxyvinyltransferase [Candidatus Peregrinibacteria bacterium]MBT7737067.1 UDP-N-acetylglucosamine 1-carboxyvinyltransferase [Candidatus Peregrinibacteria bacterium]
MPKFIVQGGKSLNGEVTVSGSKNAALPIICAALLAKGKTTLKNVPDIADIHSMIAIAESLGAVAEFSDHQLTLDTSNLKKMKIPDLHVNKMRASILVLGSLLPRFGEVKMAFPGGCVLGKRSVHAHTYALKEFGCKVIDDKKGLHIKATKLKGKKIILPELSVTATENAIMAAATADGESEIRLAANEPHIQDLCHFLKSMGAKISGIGTNEVKIKGVKTLKPTTYRITGDYLEAGTFAIAAVATKGDVNIKGINPDHLDSLWQKLDEIGAKFTLGKNSIHVHPSNGKKAVKILRTAVYPSFPTDLQAPFTVLLTQTRGVSKVFETLFEGRLNYLFELEKMGAHVEFLNPHQALIIGPTKLHGMPISSWDIRAGAAMVVAALIATGETEISNINYIDRGYEDLQGKLESLGAEIKRA